MNFKKYRIIAGVVLLLVCTLLSVIGASADNELPWVPIDPNQKPVSIRLTSQPFKSLYLVGEELDVSGANIELTYDSGQKPSNVVKLEWCSGFDSSTVGTKTVTITYPDTDCTASFQVEVVTEKSIKLVKPSKLVYFVGEEEDTAGLAVSVEYSNGESALLESGYTVSGFSSASVGEKTITVKYKELTATYTVSVVEPALLSLTIDKNPGKLSYYIGEALDLSGIKVTAHYENGITADVSSKVRAEGDLSSVGVKKITVVYSERDFIKTAEYEVTVTDVQIKNIKFSSYPKKTVYAENEAFDPTGIAITVTYNNGTTETVTENILYTGFSTDTIGKKTVTLHYGGYQLNFEVEVVVAASHVHKEGEFKLTKAPTCTEAGEETTTCTVCYETVSRRTVPATGHGAESMPVQTKAPTCTEAGETSTYCMICGGVVTVSDIFPLGHTEGEMQIVSNPTCTEKGVSKSFCTVCSAEIKVVESDALGHSFGLWSMVLEPTGEAEGREERTCTVCSVTEARAVPKLEKIIVNGDYSATLNSSTAYFPYGSSFTAEKVTEKLTPDELAALLSESEKESFRVLDVFDLSFKNVLGESYNPQGDVTYSISYVLPEGEYRSFLIYDTEQGRYTPITAEGRLSFTVSRSGRFILVGELVPEPTDTETGEPSGTVGDSTSSQTGDTDQQVSALPVKGTSAIIMILVIIAIILIVIIALLVYTYAFKQDY